MRNKTVYTGLESSGKTLQLAIVAERIAFRNARWKKKYGFARPLAFNFKISSLFEQELNKMGIPFIYWKTLRELVSLRECDVFIDEIANYFDARNWADLPRSAKKWVRQGAKTGIELYAASQSFGDVDKAFRKLTTELWEVRKVIGSPRPSEFHPPVKRIWGYCVMIPLDPKGFDANGEYVGKPYRFPWFHRKRFLIKRHTCELFDTNEEVQSQQRIEVDHVDRFCPVCNEVVAITHR